MKRQIISELQLASCYFRTSVVPPYRKALVQITEWCNLHCAHCFVSAGQYGSFMELSDIENIIIPRLIDCRVISVSLTGGEPFAHHGIIEIVSLLRKNNIKVSICTNATLITPEQMKELSSLGGISCNAKYKLLKGLLVTPNNLANIDEYSELCKFAIKNKAEYVLMNPLSSMGRGIKSMPKLSSSGEIMRNIKHLTSVFSNKIQLVNIRFPNDKKLPLASCEAGNIIYIFTRGELTVCPYMVFSAKTPQSLHSPEEFIVGNIFKDTDIGKKLDNYNLWDRYELGSNTTCKSCAINNECGKGCPAAVIASGKKIGQLDSEVCPVV